MRRLLPPLCFFPLLVFLCTSPAAGHVPVERCCWGRSTHPVPTLPLSLLGALPPVSLSLPPRFILLGDAQWLVRALRASVCIYSFSQHPIKKNINK